MGLNYERRMQMFTDENSWWVRNHVALARLHAAFYMVPFEYHELPRDEWMDFFGNGLSMYLLKRRWLMWLRWHVMKMNRRNLPYPEEYVRKWLQNSPKCKRKFYGTGYFYQNPAPL